MRKDFQVAIICAIASLPAGLAMSMAIEYFPILKGHPGTAFWSSIGVTIFLLILAAIIAVKGERAAEREGAKKRIIPLLGMIFFGIGFIGCAVGILGRLVLKYGRMQLADKIKKSPLPRQRLESPDTLAILA